jgi:glycosyltransferase involved in cell wall biosynthesis
MNKLAIVIPAYKEKYFEQAVKSVAGQTCKDFTLYIGDDAGPEVINEIAQKYCHGITLIYKRFEDNLGGKDLVAHWARCIELIKEEEWIWLFADDDIMSDECVEGFYESLAVSSKSNPVFRFNLNIIDEHEKVTQRFVTPANFSVEYFLKSYFIEHKLRNKVVEFIFSKKIYKEKGGFTNFPLAWGSDTSTMLKFGQSGGFITIDKGEVFWRDSTVNISSHGNEDINEKKRQASRQFYPWLFDFIKIYCKEEYYEKLIFRILSSQNPLPNLYKLSETNIKRDKRIFKIIIWIIVIRIKRFLKYPEIKMLLKKYCLGISKKKLTER